MSSQSPVPVHAPPRDRPDPAPSALWLAADLPTAEAHLALDEAILEEAHEGRCVSTVVRAWMANEPVVVLGSSSRVEEEVDPEACEAHGVKILRRPSGGATVMLGPGCLMWSVVTHHPEASPPIEQIHAAMLSPLAASVSARAGREVIRKGLSDLAIQTDGGERKVSGNALRVRRHGVLYHGTLLDSLDLGLVARVLRHPPREPDYRGRRPHGAFLANLGLGRDALEASVRHAFGAATDRTTWPQDAVARLVRERYADRSWIHRL
ncbi:MAG: biotin/lipoate A/B protein ligase family protein [Planctomycetia bacterium]